jgi:hypothetical protein
VLTETETTVLVTCRRQSGDAAWLLECRVTNSVCLCLVDIIRGNRNNRVGVSHCVRFRLVNVISRDRNLRVSDCVRLGFVNIFGRD